MLCFSVDSPDSLENVQTKWVAEIAENCPGVALVLVALKCDLRENEGDDEGKTDGTAAQQPKRSMIDYKQGLAVAQKIKGLRYLGELKTLHVISHHINLNTDVAFLLFYRMLRHGKPRRQRSLHRSRARGITGQEHQKQQGRKEMLRDDVKAKRSCAFYHHRATNHSSPTKRPS